MMSFLLLSMSMFVNDAQAEDDRKRAKNNTYGLGVGFTLPADSFQFNTMSIRYRVNKKITFEPMIGYSAGSGSSTTTIETISIDEEGNESSTFNDVTTDTENVWLEAGFNLRYRIAVRDTVDAYALVGFSYSDYRSEASTGEVDTVEKVNAVGAYYGVGLEGWLSENWSSSIDVFSTGFSTITTKNDNSTSTSTVNAFDPNFRIQLHLYF